MRDDEMRQLADLQRRLGEALTADDPIAFWREHLPEVALDAAGVHVAALLVTKLRFQRLVNASRWAATWFDDDPAGFAAAFRAYRRAVPGPHLDPWREAEAFDAWCESR